MKRPTLPTTGSFVVAITTITATTIQQQTATTTIQTTATTTMALVQHSNIFPDYTFQGIYTEKY